MKMWELPEEHYSEEDNRFDAEFIARRSPSEQRRQSPRKRADERAPARARLERGVQKQIARQRRESPESGQRIDESRQIDFGDDRNRDAENERIARCQFASGQGAQFRAL